MKDLAREKELERLIYERTEKYGKRKWLRIKRTFLILSGGIYLIALYNGLRDDEIDLEYLLSWIGIAPVLAGLIFLMALGVLYHILDSTVNERIEIAKLEGKLIERKYFINNKDE